MVGCVFSLSPDPLCLYFPGTEHCFDGFQLGLLIPSSLSSDLGPCHLVAGRLLLRLLVCPQAPCLRGERQREGGLRYDARCHRCHRLGSVPQAQTLVSLSMAPWFSEAPGAAAFSRGERLSPILTPGMRADTDVRTMVHHWPQGTGIVGKTHALRTCRWPGVPS